MSEKKTENKKEVGIIGQVYEDRRNGKTGKLVSRDERCATLQFVQEDGKGFICSYGSFKSNMRKKAEVVPEETIEEVIAEPVNVVEEEPEVVDDAKMLEPESKSISVDDRFDAMFVFDMAANLCSQLVKDHESLTETASHKKKMVSVCLGNKKLFEFYAHTKLNCSKVIISNARILLATKDLATDVKEVISDGIRKTNVGNTILTVNNSNIEQFFDAVKAEVIDMIVETKIKNEGE